MSLVTVELPARFASTWTICRADRAEPTDGREPAEPPRHRHTVHLRLDFHKDSISAGILDPGHETPDVEKIFHDEESVRRIRLLLSMGDCTEATILSERLPGASRRRNGLRDAAVLATRVEERVP